MSAIAGLIHAGLYRAIPFYLLRRSNVDRLYRHSIKLNDDHTSTQLFGFGDLFGSARSGWMWLTVPAEI
jgi:hypothetical protein